jgi:hypothetical protein
MAFDFTIKKVRKYDAVQFIQKHHYSPVMPALTKHYLGFYLDEELKGVITLGFGTRPRHTIAKMFPGLKEEVFAKQDNAEDFLHPLSNYYIEIGKLCLSPELNNNRFAGSQMLSIAIRWMRNNTDCLFLYTMADGIFGKVGYVYQASNFWFGERYLTDSYLLTNGEKLHPRSTKLLAQENVEWELNRNRYFGKNALIRFTKDWMKHKGIKRIEGYMFRYIYPLNRRARRLLFDMESSSLTWSKEYPKECDLRYWDATDGKNAVELVSLPFTADAYAFAEYNAENINAHKTSLNILDKFIPREGTR